ncbi:hypothetical protein MRX96_009026 [Rhipicephalus microplus]
MPPPGARRPRRREEAEEEAPEAGVPNAGGQSVGPRAGASEAAVPGEADSDGRSPYSRRLTTCRPWVVPTRRRGPPCPGRRGGPPLLAPHVGQRCARLASCRGRGAVVPLDRLGDSDRAVRGQVTAARGQSEPARAEAAGRARGPSRRTGCYATTEPSN